MTDAPPAKGAGIRTPKPHTPKPRTSKIDGTAHARGLAAEARAAQMLEQLGFIILARRARTGAGEIDLIARRDGLLVFCEVKARATLVLAGESVLPRQRRRIAAAAEAFLAGHPELDGLDMRFDAVLVSTSGEIEHLAGAFDAGG